MDRSSYPICMASYSYCVGSLCTCMVAFKMNDSLTQTCFVRRATSGGLKRGHANTSKQQQDDVDGFGPCYRGEPYVCIRARYDAYVQTWSKAKACVHDVVNARNGRCFEVSRPPTFFKPYVMQNHSLLHLLTR